MQEKCKRLTSIVLGTVHSDRTVVVLLHKHFGFWTCTFSVILSALSRIVPTLQWVSLTLWHINNLFTFFKSAYYVCLISLQHRLYFTHFHVDYTRWCRFTFLTHVGKESQCCKRKLDELCDYITNIINPWTWLTAWQWPHSLLSSNIRKVQA